MAETARLLGLGQRITFEGEDYEIAAPEYGLLGEFELWLENQALQRIERQAELVEDGRLDAATYKRRHDAMVARVGAGTYARGQDEFDKALKGYDGQQEFLYILMRAKNPRVTRALVHQIFLRDYNAAMARVLLAAQQVRPQTAQTETTGASPDLTGTPPSPPSAPG